MDSLDRANQLLDAVTSAGTEERLAAARKLRAMLDFADYQEGIAELEEDGQRRRWFVSAIADEIALALAVSVNSVQNALHRGRLVRAKLPLTWLAFCDGSIEPYVLQRLGEIAGRLRLEASFVRFDAACAQYAATHTVAETIRWAKRRADTLEPWTKAEREREAHENRAVGVAYNDEGGAELWGSYSTQMGLEIEHALNAALDAKPADDARTRDQFIADELHHRITGDGEAHLVSTEIVMTVPVASLAGITDTPAATLDENITLPADTMRDIVSRGETVFHRAITDPVGNVLDVTRLGRFFTGDLRKAVIIRDGHCNGPGCTSPIREIDHVTPWPDGPTTSSNAQGLCKRTHQQKTFGALTVEIHGAIPVWTTVLGRHYEAKRVSHPPDHGLPDASGAEYRIAQLVALDP